MAEFETFWASTQTNLSNFIFKVSFQPANCHFFKTFY